MKMKKGRLVAGIVLMALGFVLVVVPSLAALRMLAVGLGVSYRESKVTVGENGVSSFEVARLFNTGDQAYVLEASWRTTGGSLQGVTVTVYPGQRLLYPGENYLLIAEVAESNLGGTIIGVVEVVPKPLAEPSTTGGVVGTVLPAAELPFEITVTKTIESQQPYWIQQLTTQDWLGMLCFLIGAALSGRETLA
jgi:hypothetical protein